MNDQSNLPVLPPDIYDILDEYDAKKAELYQAMSDFKSAVTGLESAVTVGGAYVGSIWGSGGTPGPHERTLQENLKKSAWRYVYNRLNIKEVASAADRKAFEQSFENPPEFEEDTVFATFGKYVNNPRFHILKGLAECFTQLDPAYKSHSNIKIGVQGLPKRIILTNVGSWGSWGYDRLRDTINALRVFQGREHIDHRQFEDFLALCERDLSDLPEFEPGEDKRYHSGMMVRHKGKVYRAKYGVYKPTEFVASKWEKVHDRGEPGLKLRRFQNGNAHLIFDRDMLKTVNLALAEFYGDVLPDTPQENPEKKPSTALAKDLQFYPTPRAVIDHILAREVELHEGDKIMDPSCGEGAILVACRDYAQGSEKRAPTPVNLFGVECHPERAQATRDKGFNVFCKNFLETQPVPQFDWVIMNPPFYGLHWRKHLDHARKFLKPPEDERRWKRGRLICILPATAYYDGHLDDIIGKRDRYDNGWKDLPVASFAESGTNVPTGYLVL